MDLLKGTCRRSGDYPRDFQHRGKAHVLLDHEAAVVARLDVLAAVKIGDGAMGVMFAVFWMVGLVMLLMFE